MLSAAELEKLRATVATDPDHGGLLATLRSRAAPVLDRLPPIPRMKALLSSDGGVCPDDGATLRFDPWSPERHGCPRCGKNFSGDRHTRNWARAQHLWLAERIAEISLIAAVDNGGSTADRALELIEIYDTLYFDLPNRDNVLGPSHLFFSTYLESLWITNYLAGAWLLRESGLLPPEREEGINRVADEAATIIAEFNEGLSNRQTWHAAALTAIAAWFGDEELAGSAVESRTGLLGHLTDGFGADGLWYEGENYHLFALRGLMQGTHWAHAAGFDLLDDPRLREQFRLALLGPTRSALPDFTYPARRDARYGVSLAQPASLEIWEIGRTWLGRDEVLDAWLDALYGIPLPLPPADHYDAWLHDAGRALPDHRTRRDLSWWTLTALGPAPGAVPPWRPGNELLEDQGLAILREGRRYASLECGREIGGHGHPDRLHLTLHDGGVHWLPDPGAGSYVVPSLAWYRSALAHNAPLIDGVNAGGDDARCEAFDEAEGAAWCRARAGRSVRTLLTTHGHLVDLFEWAGPDEATVELPWHLQGEWQVVSAGAWEALPLEAPFLSEGARFVPEGDGLITIESRWPGSGATCRMHLFAPGAELCRAEGPGLPTTHRRAPFLLLRGRGRSIRWLSAFETSAAAAGDHVTRISLDGDLITLVTEGEPVRWEITPTGARLAGGKARIGLHGIRPARSRPAPARARPSEPGREARAPRIDAPPALDGTLEGFDLGAPLELNDELQYRRSEEPYDPELCSATAWVNWDGDSLWMAVEVRKPAPTFWRPDAPPLRLDNEPEDINGDGVQLYVGAEDVDLGVLVSPLPDGTLRVRPLGNAPPVTVTGTWSADEAGYLLTAGLPDLLRGVHAGVKLRFDLLVNEMRPGRLRRAGQLVWGGDGGWIYLRGDRHDPDRFGELELG